MDNILNVLLYLQLNLQMNLDERTGTFLFYYPKILLLISARPVPTSVPCRNHQTLLTGQT